MYDGLSADFALCLTTMNRLSLYWQPQLVESNGNSKCTIENPYIYGEKKLVISSKVDEESPTPIQREVLSLHCVSINTNPKLK